MPWRNAINSTKFPRVQGASRLGLDRLGLDRFGLDRLSSYRANRKAFSRSHRFPVRTSAGAACAIACALFGYDAGVRRGQDRHARRPAGLPPRRSRRKHSPRSEPESAGPTVLPPLRPRSYRSAISPKARCRFSFPSISRSFTSTATARKSPKRWWRPACPNIQRRSARSVLFRSSFFITPTSIAARPCPTWNASPGQAWRCTRA